MHQEVRIELVVSGNTLVTYEDADTYRVIDVEGKGPVLHAVKKSADELGIDITDGIMSSDAVWSFYEALVFGENVPKWDTAETRVRMAVRQVLGELTLSFTHKRPDSGESILLRLAGKTVHSDLVREVHAMDVADWG